MFDPVRISEVRTVANRVAADVVRDAPSSASEASFFPRWVLATFGGWVVGFLLMLALLAATGSLGLGDLQIGLGLGMGAGVGLVQARVLRRRLPGVRAWTAASALGMALPFLIADIARLTSAAVPYILPAAVAAGGLVTGLLQWRILRAWSGAAAWWVPACAIGWSLAGSMVPVVDRYVPKIPGIVGALLYVSGILVGGVILGVVGGAVLTRILRATHTAA